MIQQIIFSNTTGPFNFDLLNFEFSWKLKMYWIKFGGPMIISKETMG